MTNLVRCAAVLLVGLSTSAFAQLHPWSHDAERTIPNVWDTYRSLPAVPSAGELTDAVLVCRVEVSPGWDTFAGADLTISLSVRGRTVTALGPNDSDVATVSFPLSLKLNDSISVSVWDRDITTNEFIGSAQVRYTGGLPIELKARWSTVECRAITRDVAVARAQASLETADRAMKAAERDTEPDLTDDDLGAPVKQVEIAREAMEVAASWVGWRHDAVEQMVARDSALTKKLNQQLGLTVRSTAAALPARTSFESMQPGVASARVSELRCSSAKSCALTLEIRNDSKRELSFEGSAPGEAFDKLEVLQENGTRVHFAAPVKPAYDSTGKPIKQPRSTIAPGATFSVTLPQQCDPFDGCPGWKTAPALVRAHAPFGWRLLKLHD